MHVNTIYIVWINVYHIRFLSINYIIFILYLTNALSLHGLQTSRNENWGIHKVYSLAVLDWVQGMIYTKKSIHHSAVS